MYRLTLAAALLCAAPALAQELPYFVTYSHHMEEPGSLEIESKTAIGKPTGDHRFTGFPVELEYGTRAWWTSELYLEGQSTAGDRAGFTGFRLENRVRPLLTEHRINPVLYFEFENINGANKSVLEVVGHDAQSDLAGPTAEAALEKKRELELKLILSSNLKGWNISENFIAEKNVRHAPWEFGYALATSRPLRLAGTTSLSPFALENFALGLELYGGLGDTGSLTLGQTSHYLAPTANWSLPRGFTLTASPGFGITSQSLSHIYRFGLAYEVGQVANLFHRQERSH